jgi:hypothetical protein
MDRSAVGYKASGLTAAVISRMLSVCAEAKQPPPSLIRSCWSRKCFSEFLVYPLAKAERIIAIRRAPQRTRRNGASGITVPALLVAAR